MCRLNLAKACVMFIVAMWCESCNNPKSNKGWTDYGGSPDQSKYIATNSITPSNVSKLQVAWTYPTEDNQTYQWNPVIVDTVMYVLAKNNSLVALHAVTGEEIWIHKNLRGIADKGINYWESSDRKDRRLLFQMNGYLQAIDATTGKSILTFGNNGLVDLKEGLGRDPETIARVQSHAPGIVFKNLIILGLSPGEEYMVAPGFCRAYDVITGKLVWTFHTIPQPGEFGYDTWPKDAYKYVGGANVWGEISIDEKREIAYLPVGSPTYDYWGGDRLGSNLFGNCLVALDANSGKRIWHFQTVHHDLWDYDLSAAPQLITVKHAGKKTDAVALAGKTGFLYVFNRETGEPLWPIEERPVPASDVPGEQAWPTQPFPTVVPPFGRQTITSADLNPYLLSDSERAVFKKRLDTIPTGLFVPVSTKRETFSIPGAVGGASWGSTASNPEKGIVFVRSVDYPSIYGKVSKKTPPNEQERAGMQRIAGGQNIYTSVCMVCHGADRKGGVGPELLTLKDRMSFKNFRHLVANGKGEMPSFGFLSEEDMETLYTYITTGVSPHKSIAPISGAPPVLTGPVVDSGGAPGGLDFRKIKGPAGMFSRFGVDYGIPYPDGVDVPGDRYFIPPGYGLGFSHIISPPWSTITAYDLNKGEKIWQRPVGVDLMAVSQGATNTGILMSQRQGMIVTSSGILFSTNRDGKLYAFDANTGTELWSYTLPSNSDGLPSMYEINGKHYLVICATAGSVKNGRRDGDMQEVPDDTKRSYIVFSLPDNWR